MQHVQKTQETNLAQLENGKSAVIIKVDAGIAAKTRLNHLGLVPGTIIQKECSAPLHGPVCIIVKGTQLCIGRGLASKIIVDNVNISAHCAGSD